MFQDEIDFSVEPTEEKYITFKLEIYQVNGDLFTEFYITANSNESIESLPGLVYEQHMTELELNIGSTVSIRKKGPCLLAPGESFECNSVSDGSILRVNLIGDEAGEDPIKQDPLADLTNDVDSAYGSVDEEEVDKASAKSIDIGQDSGKDEPGYNSGDHYRPIDVYDPCAYFDDDDDY